MMKENELIFGRNRMLPNYFLFCSRPGNLP